MNVLFVSPEVSPFARTGGLGEVVGSLPSALKKAGTDARILCPLHKCCKDLPVKVLAGKIKFNSSRKEIISRIAILDQNRSEVPVYFLVNDKLFSRDGIYSDTNGDYSDNWLRSFVLSHAATQIEKILSWQPDIIHAHDWMTAPACGFLNAKNGRYKSKNRQASILTIHNLEHQGVFPGDYFTLSGLPPNYWGIDGFEHYGNLNLLKGGIQHAHKITTVSPTYSSEIKTKIFGHGLEESLKFRAGDLLGILNGIDEENWNPMEDSAIPSIINPHKPLSGKSKCKKYILKEFGLNSAKNLPLFGVVSRLYEQKGLDLLLKELNRLLKPNNALFCILGSGAKEQEEQFQNFARKHPSYIGVKIGFDDALARRIFAGSDFFIMPSRFEPCGLAQQYAMKYGAVPIARNTGGLSDTIISPHCDKANANGYLFDKINSNTLRLTIEKAIEDWNNGKNFKKMQKNAMSIECSWSKAAIEYQQVYRWSLN